MKTSTRLSLILLTLSGLLGLVRGFRMGTYEPGGGVLLYQYPPTMIRELGISNYHLLGWLFFLFVGVLSVSILFCIVFRIMYCERIMIVESVFLGFFIILHLVVTGFSVIHLIILPVCIGIFINGMRQVMMRQKL